jgi:hypothetical protein
MTDTDKVIEAARRGNLSGDPRILAAARTMEMKGLVRVFYPGDRLDYFRVMLTDKWLRAYGRRRPQDDVQ